jgi:hypothetical protein
VIGTEAQRTTIERIAGVTFLPLSQAQPAELYLLAMRYTLANRRSILPRKTSYKREVERQPFRPWGRTIRTPRPAH